MAGYAVGGDRAGAKSALASTVISLVSGGRGRLSALVPGRGRLGAAVKQGVSRFDGKRGGTFGMAWARAGRSPGYGMMLGRATIGMAWWSGNVIGAKL